MFQLGLAVVPSCDSDVPEVQITNSNPYPLCIPSPSPINDILANHVIPKTTLSSIGHQWFEVKSIAYLAPLPIKASPLLCLLDNVAQFLIGQLHILRKEVHALFGC